MTVQVEVTWNEFEKQVAKLVAQIEAAGETYDSIYPIPRGGLVLGVRLSHLLRIPLVADPGVPGRILVVDDISDTGQTLFNLRESCLFKDAACLYTTAWTVFPPRYYAARKTEGTWIVYPWEQGVYAENIATQ